MSPGEQVAVFSHIAGRWCSARLCSCDALSALVVLRDGRVMVVAYPSLRAIRLVAA